MNREKPQNMAWNDPGKDPWGGKSTSKKDVDKEFEEIIVKLKDLFGKLFVKFSGGKGSGDDKSGMIVLIGIIFVAILWLSSGFYIVAPAERAVQLRFGKYQETVGAGPHWHFPSPIDTVEIVNVGVVRSAELGFRAQGSGYRGNVTNESLMLTEDENIVDAKFTVQYVVSSARDYFFNIKDNNYNLKEVSQSAIRSVVGTHKMNVVFAERANIAAKIESLIQKVLDSYGAGVKIVSVQMEDVQAPEEVQEAFEDVNRAKEDLQRYINQAESYRNEVLPQARGEAARILSEARAYKEQIESKALGESSRFDQIYTEYKKSPEITRERLYLETMEQVLSNTKKVITDSSGNNIMMLPLDKMFSGISNAPKAPASKLRFKEVNSQADIVKKRRVVDRQRSRR